VGPEGPTQLRNVLLRAEAAEGGVRSNLVVVLAPLGAEVAGVLNAPAKWQLGSLIPYPNMRICMALDIAITATLCFANAPSVTTNYPEQNDGGTVIAGQQQTPNGWCCTASRFRPPRPGDTDVLGNPVESCRYNGPEVCSDTAAEARANRLSGCTAQRKNRRGAREVWLNGQCCEGEPTDSCNQPHQGPTVKQRKLVCKRTYETCGSTRRSTCEYEESGAPVTFIPPFNVGCRGTYCSDSNECGPSSSGA
jgi:hypothetical protein